MDEQTLLKHTSRSLYLSVRALPATMRPAFSVAYLLCRCADTIADTALLPPQQRLAWIENFPTLLHTQDARQTARLAQEIAGKSENPYEENLIKNLPLCFSLYNRIDPVQQQIIQEVVQAVCEGMKMDLTLFPPENTRPPRALQTAGQLEHYCRLMGGKPGLFWSKLIVHTTPIQAGPDDFFNWGQLVGDALQIVNILRDLPKDLRLGRCYFPQEDLQAAGLTPQDLLQPENSARFEPVKRKWLRWGLERLQYGKNYFRQLPKHHPRQRAAVAWPILWTADTLYRVAREPGLLNPEKRVKISRSVIYTTLLCTPALWLSNRLFEGWLDQKYRRFHPGEPPGTNL